MTERLYRPTDLSHFLRRSGFAPLRSLSQNFLIDGNIIRKSCDVAEVKEGELILEIGPGPGGLTQELLARGCRVLAVELDQGYASVLPRLSSKEEQLTVVQGDALKLPLESLLRRQLRSGEKAKVVANLPYHITSPLLERLVALTPLVTTISILLQREVGEMLLGGVGSRSFGLLSLFAEAHLLPLSSFIVSRHCFLPSPRVDSIFLHLQLREEGAKKAHALKVARQAFRHRRKMIGGSLAQHYPKDQLHCAFETLRLSSTRRPEELDLATWQALAALLPA